MRDTTVFRNSFSNRSLLRYQRTNKKFLAYASSLPVFSVYAAEIISERVTRARDLSPTSDNDDGWGETRSNYFCAFIRHPAEYLFSPWRCSVVATTKRTNARARVCSRNVLDAINAVTSRRVVPRIKRFRARRDARRRAENRLSKARRRVHPVCVYRETGDSRIVSSRTGFRTDFDGSAFKFPLKSVFFPPHGRWWCVSRFLFRENYAARVRTLFGMPNGFVEDFAIYILILQWDFFVFVDLFSGGLWDRSDIYVL